MTQTGTLLVVDDEPLNQEIIAEYLGDYGYELDTADDGEQAWSMLQNNPERYDAVLLDRMMPVLDGIEVIKRMKADTTLSDLPVVMQTAAAASEDISTGLQAGVYYYLTKPFDESVLRSIVDAAVEHHRQRLEMLERVSSRDGVLGLMTSGSLVLRTVDEARNVASFLANACPVPERAVTGLSELLLNGVEHGNLGITYDDKSRLNREGCWEAEIERRQRLPENQHKRVVVEYRRLDDRIEISIEDAGQGFDWRTFLELDPGRAFDTHGRGIALARLLSFDKLNYVGCGNRVEVEINTHPGA